MMFCQFVAINYESTSRKAKASYEPCKRLTNTFVQTKQTLNEYVCRLKKSTETDESWWAPRPSKPLRGAQNVSGVFDSHASPPKTTSARASPRRGRFSIAENTGTKSKGDFCSVSYATLGDSCLEAATAHIASHIFYFFDAPPVSIVLIDINDLLMTAGMRYAWLLKNRLAECFALPYLGLKKSSATASIPPLRKIDQNSSLREFALKGKRNGPFPSIASWSFF